jgi:hypothetical protein
VPEFCEKMKSHSHVLREWALTYGDCPEQDTGCGDCVRPVKILLSSGRVYCRRVCEVVL